MTSAKFLVQTHKNTNTLLDALKYLLNINELQRVRIASAYARWDGIGLISIELEKMISRGGIFESIYGAGNGVTTPDSLLYGLYLSELFPNNVSTFLVEDEFANSIFHPKIYEFTFPDHRVMIVGSANFTGGGMVRNTEVVAQIRISNGGVLEKNLDTTWEKLKRLAVPITPKRVRALMQGEGAGSEKDQREGLANKYGKPFLRSGPKAAPKPLFQKVIDLKSANKKSKILSKLDAISEKPKRLYLQIFENETGGNNNNLGYQVQLPVATLAAYFGVGETETKQAEFRFKSGPVVTNLTHFDNHTHRVRLKPILEIPRPAILIFERIEDGVYSVRAVRGDRYVRTLTAKCTQQSRAGSRRWGFE